MNYGQGYAAGRTLALATIGALLQEAEDQPEANPLRIRVLREARDAIAEARL
jgi:hypothetical protein